MNVTQLILLAVAAVSAALAAVFTWFAADGTKKASRGAALLSCLERYIAIMKDRREAQDEQSVQLAEDFFREMFDLHWSEFYLWRDGVIPDRAMLSWLRVRKRNFDGEAIPCRTASGEEKSVTYKECWEAAASQNYFEIDDPFRQFMDKTHAGELTTLEALKAQKRHARKGG